LYIAADDVDLVRTCRDGDQEACGALFERHHRRIYNVALRVARNREDARDITQNVFTKVFGNLGSYDPRFKFTAWIARIALNESLNFVQARRPQEAIDDGHPSDDRGPGDLAGTGDLRRVLEKALMTLSMDYRLVVILRHFMELTYVEMAAILDIPEKTVKSRLFTARQMMREALARQGVRAW
jgi:RNA polymerase sigma-70 factor (ECF subfamily)